MDDTYLGEICISVGAARPEDYGFSSWIAHWIDMYGALMVSIINNG